MDFDKLCDKAAQKLRYMALPYAFTLLMGLVCHIYMLANKISFGGDVSSIFDKGATFISGRWGLTLVQWLMPDISMPWFNGFFGLVLVSAAVCVIIALFDIKSRTMQLLLGGLMICFPAQSATLCYMFTCAPYGLSLLMAVCAVYIFEKWSSRLRWLLSPLLLILSCSIYQGYFAFASSFCVIIMIKELLEKKDAKAVFRHGLIMFVMLVVSVGLYGVTVPLAAKLAGLPILDAINDEQSLLLRFAVAYSAYLKTWIKGYFGYVNCLASVLMHLGLVAFAAWLALKDQLRDKNLLRIGLLAMCVFLFPLSCYCIYLLSDNGYIHSLALFPFSSVYVLMAVMFEMYLAGAKRKARLAVSCAMGIIIFCNVLFANKLYFQSQLQYESMRDHYTSLMAVVTQTEGFEEGVKIAVIGDGPDLRRDFEKYFELSGFQHPSNSITHVEHVEGFINNCLGYELPVADGEELDALAENADVQAMPIYPYYGSVKRVGDYMVIRLADN